MRYLVRALDPGQQIQVLSLEAVDQADAQRQARERGLMVLSATRRRERPGRRRSPLVLLLFAQELLALAGAGLGIVEALEALIEKEAQPDRRVVLERVACDLREGRRLSAALSRQPDVFPALFTGLIASAEGTSDLGQALARYIAYETRRDAMRHRLTSAAVYPVILLLVGLAVSAFLLGYVVPRFATVIAGAGRELPWASRMLMAWGRLASEHAGALGGLALAGLATGSWAAWRQSRRGGWWALLRLVPGARSHVQAITLSRLYLTLGMLLEGGIAVSPALILCQGVMPPSDRRLAAVLAQVRAGHPLSACLAAHGLSTPVALRLLRVGERSGQLGTLLTRTAHFHDEETSRWIERFARAFEPALMAAIGLVIGVIVILLYMPVFELAGSLQ